MVPLHIGAMPGTYGLWVTLQCMREYGLGMSEEIISYRPPNGKGAHTWRVREAAGAVDSGVSI